VKASKAVELMVTLSTKGYGNGMKSEGKEGKALQEQNGFGFFANIAMFSGPSHEIYSFQVISKAAPSSLSSPLEPPAPTPPSVPVREPREPGLESLPLLLPPPWTSVETE
jgi:hypothetical protein